MQTEKQEIDAILHKVPVVCFGPLPDRVLFAIKLKNFGIRDQAFEAAMKQYDKALEN
jgi:hypothetical protein